MILTIKALLDNYEKKDGTFPIIVRVTFDRKIIKLPTGLSLKPQFWNEEAQAIDKKYKGTTSVPRMNKKIQDLKAKANGTMIKLDDSGELESLSNVEIKNIILGKEKAKKQLSVFEFLDQLVKDMEKAKQHGNAQFYKTLRNVLKNFLGHEQLKFAQVTYNLLKAIEVEHYAKGNKAGGLSVYMRTLSSTYTKASKARHADKEKNPFKDYKIKQGKPTRKAMTEKDFGIFRNAEFEKGTAHYKAQKLYMASFYMRGMNWKDMALLRRKDIDRDFQRIAYVRSKTSAPINLKISEPLREIIFEFMRDYDRFENDDFVFPILDKSEPEEDETKNIRFRRQNVNRSYREISKLLDIGHFTIYMARHTFATTGKRKGVPVSVIKEGMGHGTEAMTQVYLDSFENEVVDSYDELIML